MDYNLKERASHGDELFPITVYENNVMNVKKGERILECHWHDEVEFIHMKRGSATFIIDTVSVEVKEGQVVLINSQAIHMAYSLSNTHCTYESIVFDLKMLNSDQLDSCQKDYIYPLLKKVYKFPLILKGDQVWEDKAIATLLEIIKQMVSKPIGYELFIKGFLLQTLGFLFNNQVMKQSQKKTTTEEGINAERIRKTLAYMDKNHSEKITIDDLCEEVNLSKFYFCRLFKELTGRTPLDYLNYCRMNKAALMLRESNLKISAVATCVGIDNFSYFVRLFKVYKGVTPSEFRKSKQGL